MRRTTAVMLAALLLSGAMFVITEYPRAAEAVEFTPVPVIVSSSANEKSSLRMSVSDDGRLYLAWSEKIDGDYNVMMSYSSNNGTSFSPAARVNKEVAGSQTNSKLATANGSVYVVWQDAFLDAGDIILARSDNGGLGFEETLVNEHVEGSQTQPSVAATGDLVAVAWRDSRHDNTIRIWNGTDGNMMLSLSGHRGAVRGVSFSPDGSYIASGSEDFTVKIWSSATGALARNLTHHSREVTSVAWSPAGGVLATASWDFNVTLFNTTNFSMLTRLNATNGIPVKNFPNSADLSPSGTLVAAGYNGQYGTGAPDGNPVTNYNLTVWNQDNGTSWTRNAFSPIPDKGHTNSVMDVAFSRNGTYLASCSKDATVKVWNSSTGQQVRDIGLGNRVHSLSWSPDDAFLAAGLGNGSVALVNTSSWAVGWLKGAHAGRVNSLYWGDEIISGASDPVAKIWHNESSPGHNTERLNLTGHVNSVYSVDGSPWGLVATAGGNSIQKDMGESQIFCAVSEDGGSTFSSPVMVADSCAGNRMGPDVAVDPSGTVSVAWYDFRGGGSRIYFANSTDRGSSFGKNIGVGLQFDESVTPVIFTDASGTAHVAWQHGAWVGPTLIPGRFVRYANSSDNFANSRVMASGNHTQVPSISGAHDGRSLWVTWRSRDTTADPYLLKAAVSYDGGASFHWETDPLAEGATLINQHTVFVDGRNQTYIAWDVNRVIHHRTTVLRDEWPPRILSTSPAEDQTDVSVFASFTIRFSEPMDRASAEMAFSWTDGTSVWDVGNCTGNQGTWNDYGDTVTFQPKKPDRPKYDSAYSFKIAYTAADLSGNRLGYNQTVNFTTNEDLDPPIIVHEQDRESVSYDDPYPVTAEIYDQWGTVEYARLYYQGVGDTVPATSVDMTLTGTDTYLATVPAQRSLGTIYYYIHAADASDNKAWSPANYTNQSQLYSVAVVDGVKPEISHVPVSEADVFREIEVWAAVTDSIQLQSVWLNYRPLGWTNYIQVSMPAVTGTPNTFRQVIPAQNNIGMIHYNITAMDANGNFNSTLFHSVQILDRTAPLINAVTPELLDNQTRVRVRANVTDDVEVGSVTLYFKAVGGDQWVARPMIHVSGDAYEFTIPAQPRSGIIYYYVNATDTSGNQASTLFDQGQYQIEVMGVGPNYTLYYILGGILLLLIAILAYLLITRFFRPAKSDGMASAAIPPEAEEPEDSPVEEGPPPGPEEAPPEGVVESP